MVPVVDQKRVEIQKPNAKFFIIRGNFSVSDQLKVINEYPRLFSEVEGDEIFKPIPLLELKGVIMASARSRSPSPEGWTVALFFDCFEVMGANLLSAVEESKISGVTSGAINSTFVALIPKKSATDDLEDFVPFLFAILFIKSYRR